MKHKVIKYFNCKESGIDYMLGSIYVSSDYERVQLLSKLGFIIPNDNFDSLKVEKKQPSNQRKSKKVVDKNVTEN